MDDSYRPVKLRKVVLGFNCSDNQSEFRFDLSLNYKLAGIIQTYSEQKPTLVFCATRKSVQQAAGMLLKDAKFIMNATHKQHLQQCANKLREAKLRDLVLGGIGYHHAGLEMQDRKLIEEMFLGGDLPVLMSTSTLAMGVNLPAHLVVIKSTQHYIMGVYQEYSETQILQMIGRAGRPQFDTTATAVILTKYSTKSRYEDLLNGSQLIESSLHKHLIEHINAEVVLKTITDVTVALEWIKSTFLYIRVMKNAEHYGINNGLSTDEVENKLHETGRIMARYCITYDTMKLFSTITGTEDIRELLELVSKCKEFSDIKLRVNEKKTLNTLNKDKNRATIRFPMEGKIKFAEMKVNCLIQAQFGCLSIQDFTLNQDINKIFRAGYRVGRCLVEFLWQQTHFKSFLSAILLENCFKARLWENSRYVSKQLEGIGPTLSTALVNAGIDSFLKIEETNPRQLELIVNRHPPFGNNIQSSVAGLPRYELAIEQISKYSYNKAEITVTITLTNAGHLSSSATTSLSHTCILLIGDSDNKVVARFRIADVTLVKSQKWVKKIDVERGRNGKELSINLISESWVGLDVQSTYTPFYVGPKHITATGSNTSKGEDSVMNYQEDASNKLTSPNGISLETFNEDLEEDTLSANCKPCGHRCINKSLCAHECCKFGISIKRTSKPKTIKDNKIYPGFKRSNSTNHHLETIKNRARSLLATPSLKRLKKTIGNNKSTKLSQFAYTPRITLKLDSEKPQKTVITSAKGWEVLELYQQKRSMEGNYSHGNEMTLDAHTVEDIDDESLWQDADYLPDIALGRPQNTPELSSHFRFETHSRYPMQTFDHLGSAPSCTDHDVEYHPKTTEGITRATPKCSASEQYMFASKPSWTRKQIPQLIFSDNQWKNPYNRTVFSRQNVLVPNNRTYESEYLDTPEQSAATWDSSLYRNKTKDALTRETMTKDTGKSTISPVISSDDDELLGRVLSQHEQMLSHQQKENIAQKTVHLAKENIFLEESQKHAANAIKGQLQSPVIPTTGSYFATEPPTTLREIEDLDPADSTFNSIFDGIF